MAMLVLGVNHNTASVSVREKVAFMPENMLDALDQARAAAGLSEAVIISTCNRTELYGTIPSAAEGEERRRAVRDALLGWLAEYHRVDPGELDRCSYLFWREDMLRHLMKVASGLDSMVLGEPQILGQIKSAYAVAREAGAIGGDLGRAFEEAFAVAKQVRTDTAIGESPVSVAFAAVSLAQRIFTDLSSVSALLIGAGRTVELVARHLKEAGVSSLTVANRTLEHALELKEKYGLKEVLLSDIPEQLIHADVVVSSTGSQLPILGKGAVERTLKIRKHRPIFMVDLAVPRDIEPEVGDLADVYLYSIDDLREVIDVNLESRRSAAQEAEKIIDRGVASFQRKLRTLGMVDTVKRLRSKAEHIRDTEVRKALKQLEKGDEPGKVLEAMARLLTNKLIHVPSVRMKEAGAEGHGELIQAARVLFELEAGSDDDLEESPASAGEIRPTVDKQKHA